MVLEKKGESAAYIAASYVIAYACWGALAVFGIPSKENALSMTLYLLGGLSTTVAALVIPLFAPKDKRGSYYRRYFRFNVSWKWYAAPLLLCALLTGIPYAVFFIFFPGSVSGLKMEPWYMFVPLFFTMIVGGGLEEFGWRGVLVHNMRKLNPLATGLIVGVMWACWHISLFFIRDVSQYQALFLPFLVQVVAGSIAFTALYLRSASVIPCIVAHAAWNAFMGMGFWYARDPILSWIDGFIKLAVALAFFLVLMRKGIDARLEAAS
jgi:uncharacterized protein